jgi:hypothetical protein
VSRKLQGVYRLPTNSYAFVYASFTERTYRGADESLAQPGKKQATATEDFEFHISYS